MQSERENGEQQDGPGARRQHDPAIVDAHLRALTAEAQALARASAALHDRARAVEGELNALALSLTAGAEVPAPDPEPVRSSAQSAAGDLDGARLVALNMALSGESREQIDRHLAERFELADRAKLLDEVYAAVEG